MENPVQSAGCWIDPIKMQVRRGQENIKLRPKTMQLLLLLLSKPGELISKQEMLDIIWDDVLVDEQVVFQSIKELRKLFSAEQPIKNIPRKGYIWVASVEQVISTKSPQKTLPQRKILTPTLILTGIIVSIALLIGSAWRSPDVPEKVSGSVLVLPVKTQLPNPTQPNPECALA